MEEAARLEEEKRRAEEAARLAMEAEKNKREVEVRYRRSFLSRYIQSEPYIQDYYTEIKNELLSYKGVKARTSWSKESFKRGRAHIAKIDVKGKALYLYLALDPESVDAKYRVKGVNGDCPTLIKVRSERKKKYALELIRGLMEKLELAKVEREAEDFRMPYEETDALIERGLIRVILPKGETLDENAVAVKADLSAIESRKPEQNTEAVNTLSDADELDENDSGIEALDSVDVRLEANEKTSDSESVEPEADEKPAEEISSEDNEICEKSADAGELEGEDNESDGENISDEGLGAAFSDADDVRIGDIAVPYTENQYASMSKKEKKAVLKAVKRLGEYAKLYSLCKELGSCGAKTSKDEKRLKQIKGKLLKAKKRLPKEKIWEDTINRIEK